VHVVSVGTDAAASETAWDRFVASSPDGTPFHLIAWKKVIEEVFGHVAHYLVALAGSEIRGVLPLFEIRGLRAGHVLFSVPYGVYGGLCGDDAEVADVLLDEARRLGERLRVSYVELRQLHHPSAALPTRHPFVTFAKTMHADPQLNFLAIPRKQRNMIRKGSRCGLEARRGWEPLADFYQTYAINRRRLGAPPFPRRLFEAVRNRFGAAAELLTVWYEGRLVAGVISLFHRDRVMPYYAASLPEARSLAANDFMYWELMRASCLGGFRVFDFGQSHTGSGSYDFKRHWGFVPEPVAYQYVLVRDRGMPTLGSAGMHRLVEAWKHLPLPVTTWLGPSLIRWLPLH
jgi:FemAB-related protein (PEP-CTERM system-associated)